jgi:hypothetical protein
VLKKVPHRGPFLRIVFAQGGEQAARRRFKKCVESQHTARDSVALSARQYCAESHRWDVPKGVQQPGAFLRNGRRLYPIG